ncbi:uncharacterized protein LOC134835817 [Culicoides brevitarsis]|uniref:uncharacterized protein LOC134835817 n=1 Tax=Culicoides brevitarsis TaxID=469753 RepID=UPI00307BFAEF
MSLHLKLAFFVLIGSLTLGETMFEYMPHMVGDGPSSKRKDDQRNIMDETCKGLNITGIYLNDDPQLLLNVQGQITILFKIAPNYLYFDQIAMIRQLRNRFDENGFNALQFILVISHLGEARLQKKFEAEIKLLMMDDTMSVIKETPETRPIFGMADNQAYVLDNCGRLTYIIVPPWSHIQFPYIKAAILATLYDMPCGYCNIEFIMQPFPDYDYEIQTATEENGLFDALNETEVTTEMENDVSTTENDVSTTEIESPTTTLSPDIIENELNYDWKVAESENIIPRVADSSTEFAFNESMIEEDDSNFSIPLRIILPVEHLHYNKAEDTYSKYNYVVLNTDDQSEHKHLDHDEPIEMENVLKDKQSNAKELLNELDEQAKELYISQTGQIYQLLKEYYVKGQKESLKEVALLDTSITWEEPKITNTPAVKDLRRHYELLVMWLTWQFE